MDKISKPDNFMARYQLSNMGLNQTNIRAPTRLTTWKEDVDEDFKKLQSHFEVARAAREPLPVDLKGKGKAIPSHGLSEDDYPQLRQQWNEEFADILGGTKEEVPPWREVNHEIHLIDENKWYNFYHLPQCPHSLREEFHEKIN